MASSNTADTGATHSQEIQETVGGGGGGGVEEVAGTQ